MAYSQNGWTVIPLGSLPDLVVFRWVTGRVRGGAVATVLDHLGDRFNSEVEPIDKAASWGYANRAVRGSSDVSNHASGTAVDFNAPRHVLGRRGTFTPAQVTAIRRILTDLGGVVRWGGDYAGRPDEMHFEVNASEPAVTRAAARILSGAITVAKPVTVAPTVSVPAPIGTLPDELEEDWLMGYTPQDVARALLETPLDLTGESVGGTLASIRRELTAVSGLVDSTRADVQRSDSVDRGQLTAIQSVLASVEAGAAVDAAALAAAIPDTLAAQVADELGKRLTNGVTRG